MYDIIVLSYDEPNAEEQWAKFKDRFCWAKRVSNIKGIRNAHLEAAKQSISDMFWVVDIDSVPLDWFDFSFVPEKSRQIYPHIWYAKNPVNGLKYGYGGIKLFPKSATLKAKSKGVDFTTTSFKGLVLVEKVASITYFNTSPYNTWRGAFRESVKLTLNLTKENAERLSGWMTKLPDARYGQYSVDGAEFGQRFAKENKNSKELIEKINNYDWLLQTFEGIYGSI